MHYILVLILFLYSAFAISAQEILDKNPNKQGILPNNKLIYHGQAYQDEFAWLRDADHPIINDAKIKRFIKDENAKSAKYFAENSELLRTVFEEIKSRRGKLEKPATEDKTYIYTSKYLGENQYITHFYTDKVTGKKAVMLDENLRAKSFDHYELNAWSVSPNGKFLAWVEDTAGSNKGVLYVKSLQTSNINSLTIANVGASIVWNDKSNKLYYSQQDAKGSAYQIKRHSLDSNKEDEVIYTEKDENFTVNVVRSGDKIFISSSNWDVEETLVLTEQENDEYKLDILVPRTLKSLTQVEYINDSYYAKTNFLDENFDLVKIESPFKQSMSFNAFISRDSDVAFKDIIFLQDFFAIIERSQGADKLRVINRQSLTEHYVEFDEPRVGLYYEVNKPATRLNAFHIRAEGSLMARTLFKYDAKSRQLNLIQQTSTKSYKKANYQQEYLLVESHDGVKVPATVIYHNQFGPGKNNPVCMYVYGSYAEGIPPEFPTVFLSAIDRGCTMVTAHVRGGDELGQQWYESGKLLNKKNSFYDFLAIADYLVEHKYTTKGNISATGESASGLVIGYAINARPELFNNVSMLVPYVDPLNSLMDDSLKYTLSDRTEFGDPMASKAVFNYIKSYAPYDNIKKQNYPNIYVSARLNDIAVGYWEPAKWLSKIRANQLNQSKTLIELIPGGHIASGKHAVDYDFAKEVVFMISEHGTITK